MTDADPDTTPRDRPARARAGRRLRGLGLLAAVVLVIGATVSAVLLLQRGGPARSVAAPVPVYVRTDRAAKSELLDALPQPPQLLIFGGSRSTRFEPARFTRLTGLRAFNLAFQNGRPEDAWAFLNDARTRWPGARFRAVWFLHVEAFREQGLSAGLVQDPELARWFPPDLVAAERAKLPTSAAEAPLGRDLALTEYGADGVVLRNRYDLAEANGATLEAKLDWSIGKALERYQAAGPALFPRSQHYFERTIALLNDQGSEPVVVLMPLHPRLLEAVRDEGWAERHREVMRSFEDLQETHAFTVLDLSELATIGGDPDDFYDGFHVKRANARRLIRAVVERAPSAFR
jgi:hypothetical protein